MKKILVTGALGFIGFHLTKKLIEEGYQVVGIDVINSYYDVRLKYAKLPLLGFDETHIWPNVMYQSSIHPHLKFSKTDISERYYLEKLMNQENFDIVCNLAAQAGVQYSIANPHTYITDNITGFINIMDTCRQTGVSHFIYASSSSVYGDRDNVPFREDDNVDNPISLYAATKKSNELMAHSYSHLFNLKTTGLRFFTVYGPWGRPDMAPFLFVKNIHEGKKITVFNNGDLERDFTYVSDIVNGIFLVIKGNQKNDTYQIYNIGNSNPVNLHDFIQTIENALEKKAIIDYQPMRKGDVKRTFSDVNKLTADYGYKPSVGIREGISRFVEWYLNSPVNVKNHS
ncbi:MAG: NAD-dependent epimerase/dehydratase family protein [Lentimicrobium sp.]|nr:GDP-mannose 4,6-dehydratase [Lentimicrobiaceae bacterium]MCO5265936.1 NAD-dependent epimerase/dehydratase family protein [Lentimicrobium sp.]